MYFDEIFDLTAGVCLILEYIHLLPYIYLSFVCHLNNATGARALQRMVRRRSEQ